MPDADLHVRRIALVVGGIAAIVLVAVLAVLAGLSAFGVPHGGERLARAYRLAVPGPQLQSAPQVDLYAYRQEKDAQLEALAWLDGAHTHAKIPLADAMALLASGAVRASVPAAAALPGAGQPAAANGPPGPVQRAQP